MVGGPPLLKNPLLDIAAVLSCQVAIVVSLLICPFVAFYIRQSVFELSPEVLHRVLIFGFISTFPMILLAAGFYSIDLYQQISYERSAERGSKDNEAHQKILDELKGSGIEVAADDARIITDQRDLVIAEVTLHIRKVPLIVPYYNIFLAPGKNEKGISYKFHNFPDGAPHARSLRAQNQAGKWVFYKDFTDELVSDNSDNVTVQLEIFGVSPSDLQITTTITPLFTAWSDETGPYKDSRFLLGPIPITIRRNN